MLDQTEEIEDWLKQIASLQQPSSTITPISYRSPQFAIQPNLFLHLTLSQDKNLQTTKTCTSTRGSNILSRIAQTQQDTIFVNCIWTLSAPIESTSMMALPTLILPHTSSNWHFHTNIIRPHCWRRWHWVPHHLSRHWAFNCSSLQTPVLQVFISATPQQILGVLVFNWANSSHQTPGLLLFILADNRR
jgi:hypothetical protein